MVGGSTSRPDTHRAFAPVSTLAQALRQLFWDSVDGMVITDRDQRVLAVNPAFEAVTGISREEWMGQKPSLVKSGSTPERVYDEMWNALNTRGKWLGEVINRRPDGSEWVSYLSITRLTGSDGAVQGYVGITRDVTQQKQYERELVQNVQEIDILQESSVLALAEAAEFRDPDIAGHLYRIRRYTELLVNHLRDEGHPALQDPWHSKTIIRTSVLHDIGKVGVPEGILFKPGRLRPEEYDVVKTHTVIGERILTAANRRVDVTTARSRTFFGIAAKMARHHHERWDGKGYPDGLAGEAIPFCARIVSLADVYDALTSRRVYKDAWSPEKVEQYMADSAGTQFDPVVVEAFWPLRDSFRELIGKEEES